MGTYKNDYTKEEDYMLWELHEIRHEVQLENQGKTIEEINENAMKILERWKAEAALEVTKV